jgi:flavin reductase (DIM6/NTAB) family NADH-FMN oxidoreductase RutF
VTVSELPAGGLRRLAMPVVIVAAEHDGRRSCSTATAMYASLDPVTLVVSLARHSTTQALVDASGRFSVSVLATHQVELALSAGRRSEGDDKFAAFGIPVDEPEPPFVVPSVAGAEVSWCCRVTGGVPVGDHAVVVGEMIALRGDPDGNRAPLLRHDRLYTGLGEALAVQDRGGYPL